LPGPAKACFFAVDLFSVLEHIITCQEAGGEDGALRFISFPLCARWSGGRKVFENKRRTRGKTSERAAVSRENNADFRRWRSRAENSARHGDAHAESLWEDKAAKGETLREGKHQEGHGATCRLNHGRKKSERTSPGRSPCRDDGNGQKLETVPQRVKSQEGRGPRKRRRPGGKGKPLEVRKPEALFALTGGASRRATKTLRGSKPCERMYRERQSRRIAGRPAGAGRQETLGAAALSVHAQARKPRRTGPGEERNPRRG